MSVDSAQWGQVCGVVEADHNELINWHMPGRPPRWDALAWYRGHVKFLLGENGDGEQTQ